MRKRSQSIINKLYPISFIAILLVLWQAVCTLELVPAFMLPSPISVIEAFIADSGLLFQQSLITIQEAFWGLLLSIIASLTIAVIMDEWDFVYKACYPIIVLTQTVPTIAIAPLLVLWLGYGMAPKITLVFITCFFPLTVSILTGLKSCDEDTIRLFKSMGASKLQILTQVKLPYSLENFFAGLKVAVTYAFVGAVISEWLGGNGGLGVYMTRVRKAYSFDKMFAVIFLISIISLLAMLVVSIIAKKSMPWKNLKGKEE